MSEVPGYRDPDCWANSDVWWNGAECEADGCEKMAGTKWGPDLCWEHNAEQMEEFREMLRDTADGNYGDEIEQEKNMSREENSSSEKSLPEESQEGVAPQQNHFHSLIDRLDPIMGSDMGMFTRIKGHDEKPNPAIRLLTPEPKGAAKIDSPDVELTWYPTSQLATNINGELFMANWLFEKNRMF